MNASMNKTSKFKHSSRTVQQQRTNFRLTKKEKVTYFPYLYWLRSIINFSKFNNEKEANKDMINTLVNSKRKMMI